MGEAEMSDEMPTFTMSWPLMPGDDLLSRDEIVLKYNLRHVVAHLDGMRLDEVTRLGGPDAWQTISAWVDDVRAGR